MRDNFNQVLKDKGKVWKEFCEEEEGVGIVEVILILVILISIVLLFKEKIMKIVNDSFKSITDDSKGIIS